MGNALQTSDEHACPRCGDFLPTEGFTARNRVGMGVGWCKACVARAARKWNAAHPERVKLNYAAYRQREKAKRSGLGPEREAE